MNPMMYENFNKLFHITKQLELLVRKLDVDEKHSGYLRNIGEEIDRLFLSNVKKENKQ